ncbi:MAG: heparan-alpha-glucosaminide N-acetyltransferase [Lachnospiraceae bacterium]
MKEEKTRIYMIDILRGILIIYVVYYHFMYDLNDILGYNIPYLYSKWFSAIRDVMSGSLIFISGISCNFSRNNIKRGARTILVALVLSIVTLVVMPEQTIIFGILHLLGTMMVIYGVIQLAVDGGKKEKYTDRGMSIRAVLMCLFIFLFVFSKDIYYGYVRLASVTLNLPRALYGSFPMYIMGFAGPYVSADYYPIIPWGFLFLAGAMVGYVFNREGLPKLFYKNVCPPLAFIGRHTMFIYIVHQPILLGIFMLVNLIKG